MPTGRCQSSAKEMNSEQPTTNPANPGPPDDRFNALTTRPHCLLLHLKKRDLK